jgi:magnesium transporter
VGETFLITICKNNLPVGNWFEQAKVDPKKSKLIGDRPGLLLYKLVDRLVDQGLGNVRELETSLDSLDQKMAKLDKRAVEEVSLMRRNLIIYTTTLKPMNQIFKALEKTEISYLNGNLRDYWGSITDHLHQMYDQLTDYRELLDGLTEAYEMLLTQKTNEIIRLLTIFSVLLLPLTLVASIYGMNIQLPYGTHKNAFEIVSIIMLTLLGGMLGFFRWRRWL